VAPMRVTFFPVAQRGMQLSLCYIIEFKQRLFGIQTFRAPIFHNN